jgi:hypothetical protein
VRDAAGIARVNDDLCGVEVTVKRADGSEFAAEQVRVTEQAVHWRYVGRAATNVVPVTEIEAITRDNRGRGFLVGLLLGAGASLAVGEIAYQSEGEAAEVGGVAALVLLLGGGPLGSASAKTTFDLTELRDSVGRDSGDTELGPAP